MHVSHLDDHPSPLAAVAAPPFPPRSCESLSLRVTRLIADLTNVNSRRIRSACNWCIRFPGQTADAQQAPRGIGARRLFYGLQGGTRNP